MAAQFYLLVDPEIFRVSQAIRFIVSNSGHRNVLGAMEISSLKLIQTHLNIQNLLDHNMI
jgi:hypothetical protein